MTDLRTVKVLILATLATLVLGTTTFSGAVFTDSSTSTATVRAAADWTAPTAELQGAAGFLRGTVTLAVSASDADSAVSGARVERRAASAAAGSWTVVCAQPQPTFTCTWDTAALPDGLYDVRATASDTAGNEGSTTAAVTLDNTVPTVRLDDPGSPLSGTVRLAADATDATSGVATVELRAAPAGSSTWTTLCTATGAPWSCDADTRALPHGTYDLQAVATDRAGNTAFSARVGDRVVDNVVTTVTLAPVPSVLTGPVALSATPTTTGGLVYVRLQYAPGGTTDWRTVCEVTTAPWSCSWDTTTVADGTYDVRAQVLDTTGRYTASTPQTGRRVKNAAPPVPLSGADVQAVNGSGRAGWLDQGDSVTFTFAQEVRPGDVLPGWAGTDTPVTLRVRDGKYLGRGDDGDGLDVLVGETVLAGLGSVNLRSDLYQTNQVATFSGTMRMSTVTTGGTTRSTVRVVLGAPVAVNASHLRQGLPAAMLWTDATGRTVTETGEPADVDF